MDKEKLERYIAALQTARGVAKELGERFAETLWDLERAINDAHMEKKWADWPREGFVSYKGKKCEIQGSGMSYLEFTYDLETEDGEHFGDVPCKDVETWKEE